MEKCINCISFYLYKINFNFQIMNRLFLLVTSINLTAVYVSAQVGGNYNYDKNAANADYANAPAAGNSYYNEANANYSNNNFNVIQPYSTLVRTPVTAANIEHPDLFHLTVNGLINVVAENYVATFNLIQVGETAETTDNLMNGRIHSLKQNLSGKGIDTSTIITDLISFVPKYDYQVDQKVFSKTFNEVPAGFELQKNVLIHFTKSFQLDDIISAAAKSEIYDLVKVDYFVTDVQKQYELIRAKCVEEMLRKEKDYLALGFKLDTVYRNMAEDYKSVYPESRYYSYSAFCKPSLDAARKKTGASSNAKVIDNPHPVSKFYNAVNYDEYDVVVNPVVTEPVVQFSYSITVRYVLHKAPDPKNNYFLVTPTGTIQQIFPK